jgi:chloride channel 3/4/5
MAVFWTMTAKAVLTTITFGIKLPAGIFIPSLAVGACFGRIVGLLVQYIQWTQPHLSFFSWCSASDSACIIPGTYSMLGAAATLSGVTRSTVSLAVIMFELTGTLTYAIPVAISILVARTVADSLQHQGIYDLVIEMSGLPFLDPKLTYTWKDVSVKDAMDTEVEVIRLDEANTVDSLQSKLAQLALGMGYTDGGFPIVVPSEIDPPTRRGGKRRQGIRMVGYIAAQELEYGLSQLLRQQPDLNPSETICTFAHIPQANGNDEDEAMADSLFLRSDEPQDFSRFVDQA